MTPHVALLRAGHRLSSILVGWMLLHSILRPFAFIHQDSSKVHPRRFVDVEHLHGGATDLGAPEEDRAEPMQMPSPGLPTWVEQHDNVARYRIDARKVGPLVEIAPLATPTTVIGVVGAAVL